MSEFLPQNDSGTIVYNDFIRERNVLYSHADFSGIFVDFYLHLEKHKLKLTPEQAEMFKEFLAAFVLHAASHPRNEVLAWTIHLMDPLLNIFLTGDTEFSTVAGRIFTEGVKADDSSMFYQDLKPAEKPLHRSIVGIEGNEPLSIVGQYYAQSEQRPAKVFSLGGDAYALFSAHPDCDEIWFNQVNEDNLSSWLAEETLARIESRHFRWLCGCHHQKIIEILASSVENG